jgi:hypothetical protein
MNRPHAVFGHRSSPSVVVNDLDVFFRAGRRPAKTQPELIVHADAVLPCAVAALTYSILPSTVGFDHLAADR